MIHMLDIGGSQELGALTDGWDGFGLDELQPEADPIVDVALLEDHATPPEEKTGDEETLFESAMDLFRRNLRHYERLSPEEEKALGEALEQLYIDIVNTMLVWQHSAIDLLAVLKRFTISPLDLPVIGDRQGYYSLLREIQVLTKPASKLQALEQAIRLIEDFIRNRQSSHSILPSDVQHAVKTIAWPGPLTIALAQRYSFKNNRLTKIDMALEKYLRHHGHTIALESKPEQSKNLLTLVGNYYQMRDTLVVKNIPLVMNIVNRYCLRRSAFPELLQEGIIGLIRAAEKYRASTGNRFSTYAYNWIESKVRAARVKNNSLIPVAPSLNTELARLHACIEDMRMSGKSYDIDELSIKLDSSPARVRELLNLQRGIISLDTSMFVEDSGSLHAKYPDPKSNVVKDVGVQELRTKLKKLLPAVLNSREVLVISKRFGLNAGEQSTLAMVGKELNTSGENVRLIEQNALKKLRVYLQQAPIGKDLLLAVMDADT